MSTKFYCNSEICGHAEKGPFVLELAQETVMDGNNLATMKQLPSDPQKSINNNRFYCHSDACNSNNNRLFFIDLPGEAIMDNNNMATIFCPKCGKEMKPFDQEPSKAVNF